MPRLLGANSLSRWSSCTICYHPMVICQTVWLTALVCKWTSFYYQALFKKINCQKQSILWSFLPLGYATIQLVDHPDHLKASSAQRTETTGKTGKLVWVSHLVGKIKNEFNSIRKMSLKTVIRYMLLVTINYYP
jgi:hypothetical protein